MIFEKVAVQKSAIKGDHDYYEKINIFPSKQVTKELISQKILSVIAFYSTFPHCELEINFVIMHDLMTTYVDFTQFLQNEKIKWVRRSKFPQFLYNNFFTFHRISI